MGVRLALNVSISDIRGTFDVGRVRDEGLEGESYQRYRWPTRVAVRDSFSVDEAANVRSRFMFIVTL